MCVRICVRANVYSPALMLSAPNKELIAIVDAHHVLLVRTHRHCAHRVHRLVVLQYLIQCKRDTK